MYIKSKNSLKNSFKSLKYQNKLYFSYIVNFNALHFLYSLYFTLNNKTQQNIFSIILLILFV